MLAEELRQVGARAKEASLRLAGMSTRVKDDALQAMARSLEERSGMILEANQEDMEEARKNGLSGALLDRLMLTPDRVSDMAQGLRALVALPDPVGEVVRMWTRPNGLQIGKMRVPLGVIGIIYEARPNVTVDAAGLCYEGRERRDPEGRLRGLQLQPGDHPGDQRRGHRRRVAAGNDPAGEYH